MLAIGGYGELRKACVPAAVVIVMVVDGSYELPIKLSNGKEIGEWIVFNNEGQRHGLYRRFDTEGNLREKGVYDKGQKSGIWEEFNAKGSRIGYSNH